MCSGQFSLWTDMSCQLVAITGFPISLCPTHSTATEWVSISKLLHFGTTLSHNSSSSFSQFRKWPRMRQHSEHVPTTLPIPYSRTLYCLSLSGCSLCFANVYFTQSSFSQDEDDTRIERKMRKRRKIDKWLRWLSEAWMIWATSINWYPWELQRKPFSNQKMLSLCCSLN